MALIIKNLTAKIDNKIILENLNLEINDGKVIAIMGPNGVGKSTLANIIMGYDDYQIASGHIIFNDINITNLNLEQRSKLKIFLSMQNPVEIEGITNLEFLKTAYTSINNKLNLFDFIKECNQAVDELKLPNDFLNRYLNVGFSGGEKKKNEVLQIKLLKPEFIILDELDSGLDVDSLKTVCTNINKYKKEHPNTSILIITHYPRILKYIHPDEVCILKNKNIIATGNYDLALDIEKNGYDRFNHTPKKENHE